MYPRAFTDCVIGILPVELGCFTWADHPKWPCMHPCVAEGAPKRTADQAVLQQEARGAPALRMRPGQGDCAAIAPRNGLSLQDCPQVQRSPAAEGGVLADACDGCDSDLEITSVSGPPVRWRIRV